MEKRCFACMSPTDSNVCRHCGHDNAGPGNGKENLLKPGTVVGGRYLAGLAIDCNGEGVTYIAFDENVQTRVRLREFFPGALCHREADRKTVTVNIGCEIQYKALMTDFVELSKQLIGITANTNLLKARDILSDNGTIYVVYEDVNGVTLTKYLMEHAGALSWEDTENLFLPLLYTVKLLNAKGIIHRGISPDTIIVTENHELKLKGICTSAVRAINTEIKSELFAGYAAPEQYEKCASHGEWTDVYAVCAVLYKTLTGTMPERADIRRGGEDTLVAPVELDASIPRNVSDAIMRGLACERARRTLYIKDLIGGLYAALPQNQPARRIVEEEDDEELEVRMPSRRPNNSRKPAARRKKKRLRVPVWLIVILITLPMMLALFFLTYYYVLGDGAASSAPASSPSSEESSSAPSSAPVSSAVPSSEDTASSVPKVVVDNFVGQNYDDVISNEAFTAFYTFEEKQEEYDESAPIGQIIKQSIEKNTVVEQGAKIVLTVSKGRRSVTIPPFVDENNDNKPISLDTYKQYLVEQGLNVKVVEVDDPSFPKGQIVRLSQEAGTAVDREASNDLTIYVSTGESYDVLYGGSPFDSED